MKSNALKLMTPRNANTVAPKLIKKDLNWKSKSVLKDSNQKLQNIKVLSLNLKKF